MDSRAVSTLQHGIALPRGIIGGRLRAVLLASTALIAMAVPVLADSIGQNGGAGGSAPGNFSSGGGGGSAGLAGDGLATGSKGGAGVTGGYNSGGSGGASDGGGGGGGASGLAAGGGGGGAGGAGLTLTTPLTNAGTIKGGNGGNGGSGSSSFAPMYSYSYGGGGGGGGGGSGIIATTGASLVNSGTISGGDGGGGASVYGPGISNSFANPYGNGAGGNGGNGITATGSIGLTITNQGTIRGGGGGTDYLNQQAVYRPQAGGYGIIGQNLTILNSGTIQGGARGGAGGLSGNLSTAIVITGGANSIAALTGSNIGAIELAGGTTQMSGVYNNTLQVDGGATMTLGAAGDATGFTTLTNAGGTINVGDGNTLSAGAISNSGGGKINLGAGAMLYGTGNTLNNSSTINVGTDGIVTDNGDINNNAGGIINFNGPGGTAHLAPGGNVNNSGQINVVSGDVTTPQSTIINQNNGSVSLTGGNLLNVSTFTNQDSATLNIAAGYKLGVQVLNFNGGTATGTGTIEAANAFYLWGPGAIGVTLAGAASLSRGGPGTTVLTGANTYTGGTTINAGELQLGTGGTTGSILGQVNVRAAGTFTLTNAATSGITSITNAGTTNFRNGASAGTATLANNGDMYFYDTSTAGSAGITNYGYLYFNGSSSAGSAGITNKNILEFHDSSTGGSAVINNGNGSSLNFSDTSSAGSASITNDGALYFNDRSTGGNAAITNNAAGTVDFSYTTGTNGDGKISAGSIAGAGSYSLGANALTVGSNNLSTEVSGVISGVRGALVKTGAGTLTLSGANTYTGGTTINAGILQLGSATGTGAIQGAVTVNWGGTFNVVNADTSGIAGISIDSGGATNFSNGTSAGGATIANRGSLIFFGTSTAGHAAITNNSAYATTDFSFSTGPNNDNKLSAGSIAGDGFYNLGGNQLTVGSNNSSTEVSGVVSGNGGSLVKVAQGTLTLSGDNTYTGGTTISAGTLQLGNDGTTGSIRGDVLNNGTLAFNRNDTMTFSGAISGTGAVQQIGSGTTILTGTNSYTGDTTVSSGRLQFGDGSAGGSNTLGGNLNVTGGTLAIQTPATVNVAQAVTFADNTALSIVAGANSPALSAGSVSIGSGVAFNISGIDSTSQLDKVLIDTQSGISGDFANVTVGGFSGAVDYLTVNTHKSADSLQYLASTGLSWFAGNNLAHGTFTLTNASDTFTVGTALTDQAANPATGWNGTSLTKAGAGTLILTGTNTYSGGTTVTGGTLSISSDGNLGNGGTLALLDGTTLAFTQGGVYTHAITVAGDPTFDVATGQTVTQSGAISDGASAGDVVKTGAGTLMLTASNTYSGGTTISGGTLQLGNGGASGSIAGDVVNNGTLAFNRSDVATFSGNISGSGVVQQIGTGTTILTGTNSYTGGTTISAGTLQLGDAGDTDAIRGAVIVGAGGTLKIVNADTSGIAGISVASGGYTYFSNDTSAGSAVITNSGGLYFYDTSTAGSANITNNNGLLSFSGTSTAGSATITNNGWLYFYSTSTAGNAAITNGASGIIDFSGSAGPGGDGRLSAGSIAGGGTFNLGGDELTVGANGASTEVSGVISGTGLATGGSLVKTGQGTLTLSGDNTYTGGTTISAGTLQLGNDGTTGSIRGDVLNNGTLAFNRNDTMTFSGAISGTGAVQQIGSGTTILTGTNSYTGDTTVSSGRLQFGDGSAGGSNTLGGNLNVTGGTLAIQTPATVNVAQAVTFADNTALSIVAGANSPALSAGSVSIGSGVAFNISGIDSTSQLDKVLIDTQSGISGDFANVTVGGFSGAVDYLTVNTHKSADSLQYLASTGLSWFAGNNLAHGTFTLTNASDTFTVGTALTDQAANPATGWNGTSLTKAGAGTLILTGTNTYSGGTTVTGGVLSVSRDANLGAATGGLTFTGGTLAVTGSFDTARSIALTQTGSFDVASGTELGLTGVVSGSGDLIKQGSGTLRLDNGANTYGNTLVAAGTLIGNAASISGNIANAGTVVFNQRTDASFGGDIGALNGTGGTMVKQGSGALTLAGTSSLDWTIEAGSLVSSAERFGGNAAIASGASFTFNQNADAAYAGVLSGNGGFNKIGSGLLNLTGDSSAFTGTTSVQAGTLAVNGLLGGTLDVLAGGRLQGNGTVGNTTVNGTIAPGNSIGTLHVAGNIIFNSGSIYEVEVNAQGDSDKIIASGKATINGGTVRVLAGAGSYAPQTQYTIITADLASGGVIGTFNSVTSNLAFLTPSLSYDASNVWLTMTRNNIDFKAIGATSNQIAAGGATESLGFGAPLYNAVLNLSAPQARSAFGQLSGEIHASAKTAMIEDSRFVRSAVNDRIRAAFDSVGAANGTVTTYVDGKPVTVAATTDRFAVWGQGFGSWGNTNGDGNAARLNRSTGGFFIGADAPAFYTWRFGAVAGYSRTNFNVRDRASSGWSDNYHVGLYGGMTWGALAFRTGAAYTWHDVTTNRSVIFSGFGDTLKSNTNAGTAQVFGELGYGINANFARFEPFANLAYVSLHTDGFTEKGGAAALTSAASTTDTTFTTLGLRASTTFEIDGTALTAKGMVGWRHAFGDAKPFSTIRFASGGDAFTIGGVPIARNAAVVEAGIDYAITPNATLGVTYGGQFGSGMSDQSARFNFNVKF